MPRLVEPDPPLPRLASMRDANTAGLTRGQVRHRLRSSAWHPIRHGAYLPEGEHAFEGLDSHGRARTEHVFRALAAAERNPGGVVTDTSAAIWHGLPVVRLPHNVVLGVPPDHWTGSRHGIDFRARTFVPDDVEDHRVPVATALRCWTDITRYGTLADSLVCGDAALRLGLMPHPASAVDLDRWAGRRGCRLLRRAIALIDGVRESPLESASVAYFIAHRLPAPVAQVEIRTRSGLFVARVDFLWERARLVGEADGRLKYLEADGLYAEKRREDAIRAEGFRVVRWGMADLRSPQLARRIRRLLG